MASQPLEADLRIAWLHYSQSTANQFVRFLMYEDWKVKRWETPISDVKRLLLVSMSRTYRNLVIEVEAFRDEARPRWRVEFEQCSAFRCIDEAYRTALWEMLDETGQRCGNTFTAEEPTPLASWGTVYLHVMQKGIRNYVLGTEDDVFEVLTSKEPRWVSIPTGKGEKLLAGSPNHLYMGEDDQRMQSLVEEIRKRNE